MKGWAIFFAETLAKAALMALALVGGAFLLGWAITIVAPVDGLTLTNFATFFGIMTAGLFVLILTDPAERPWSPRDEKRWQQGRRRRAKR